MGRFNTNKTFSQFHSDYSKGVDEKVRAVRKTLFGENLIAVPVPNWFVLLIDKVCKDRIGRLIIVGVASILYISNL